MEANKKKDWVKNAIIIFLVIMLLLTFFSNTITNYTLPTVTTRTATSGTVTSGIRESGNIEAGESYVMKAEMTRKIESVKVEKEQHVNRGDVIFTLQDADSEELKKAQEELDTAELNYYKSLLASDMSADMAASVNANGLSSFDSYIAKIDKVQTQIEEAQQVVNDAQAQVDQVALATKAEASRQVGTTDAAELEKTMAELCKEDASAAFTAAKNKAVGEIEQALSNYGSSLTEERAMLVAVNGMLNSGGKISDAEINAAPYVVLKDYRDFYYGLLPPNRENDTDEQKYARSLLDGVSKKLDYYIDTVDVDNQGELDEEYYELQQLKNELSNLVFQDDSSYACAIDRIRQATINLNNIKAQNARTTANYAVLETVTKAYLDTAKARLTQLQEDKKALTNDIGKALEADNYSKVIERKQDEIDNLRQKYENGVVVAEVSGKITAINLAAGETMEKDKEICTIIPDGKSYQVQLHVKTKDTINIQPGDAANFEETWNYPDAVAIVNSIKDDPDNPGNGSIISLELTGSNLKVGKSVMLSMGLMTKNYDLVVPKAALKKDSKGDFVWVLNVKESALGNKYTVERVEVKIIDSDDKSVAVRGNLMPYSDVVVTASKDIQDGKRVRLSDTNAN